MLKNKLIALFQQVLAEFVIELFIEFFIQLLVWLSTCTYGVTLVILIGPVAILFFVLYMLIKDNK